MAQIRIKRFGAGDGEEHGAERHKTNDAVMDHEGNRMERIERQQHFGVPRDVGQGRNRNDHEPDAHHRAEESGDPRRATRLNRE